MHSQVGHDPFPDWTPPEITNWIEKIDGTFSENDLRIYNSLARDLNMKEVWAWYSSVQQMLPKNARSSTSFCITIRQCMRMPGKPGNMPSKRRADYLLKVRKQAETLASLLADTRFDCWRDDGKDITDVENIETKIAGDIQSALSFTRSESTELLFAYRIDEFGVSELPWDFPNCHLVGLLNYVVEWTYESDLWGRGFQSSKAIRQAGSGARAIYFNCTLYEALLRRTGVKVPFEILANIANTALELPFDDIVSAETARKQVTRYLDRVGRPPPPLAEDSPY